MSMTVGEYHKRWQSANIDNLPLYEEKITRTSCIFFEGAVHSFMGGGEGYTILPDFGDAICWYRYVRLSQEFEDEKKPLTPEEVARKETMQQELDALLECYVSEDYQQDMGEKLRGIVERLFEQWELGSVYVMPQDLPDLLDARGDPRVPQVPAFDFDNPEHCRALEISLEL